LKRGDLWSEPSRGARESNRKQGWGSTDSGLAFADRRLRCRRVRNARGWKLITVLLLTALAGATAAQDKGAAPQIGYKSAQDAEQKKTLLLRDYKPQSMLRVPAHTVEKAKFYVVDVHNHVNDAQGIEEHMSPSRVVQIMDATNVRTVIILTGKWGDKLQRVIDEMQKPYPGRFIVFTQIDWGKIDDPDFSQEMVHQLDDAVARGARGLKILKDLGLGVRDKSGKLITPDDARLDPIFEECGRLGIPVSIHTGDPEAFFHPIDGSNERYEELIEHPDWSFYGSDYPSLEQVLEARNRTFSKHPKTTFVSLHMGWPENLPWVARMLNEHPNVLVEFGAREAELGRQPREASEFFLKYQDRIMFGTDNGMEEEMYRNLFRWLETPDEYFDYWGYPAQGRWKIYGLGLPDAVLEKIYHGNAERMFAQFKAPGKKQ
jgi:predicted TIM-barrel fold metal-dependent hydrolase